MYYIYAIKSLLNQRIYIGQTDNLERRAVFHNSGKVISTYKDLPWKIIACQIVETREEARWIEYNIKRSFGKRNKWINQNEFGDT